MKAHQLFLLIFWFHNVYSVLGATWEIDFSPFKQFFESFTIKPSPFYRSQDVTDIHSILDYGEPNEIGIVEILSRMNDRDRQLLSREYQRAFGTRLVNDLRDKLTGKLEEAVVAIMTPLDQFLAQEINDAIYGFRSDETALIDTLCLLNTTMLDTVKDIYKKMYGDSMEYEIRINTVGSFGKLMVACINNMRPSGISKDDYVIQIENGIIDDDLINFITQTSFAEMRNLGKKHKSLYGKQVEDVIKAQFSGDFARALITILKYALSEKLYFVIRFHESLEGRGVDHRSLIRLIMMEKSVRYEEIRDFYRKLYHKDIDDVLTKKLPPGSYRKLIQGLFIKM